MNGIPGFEFLTVIILAPLLLFALIGLLNTLAFPRLQPQPKPRQTTLPRVSVLIPMRNEADKIGPNLRALLAQEYPDSEVLVLDDDSQDDSARIAAETGGPFPNFKLLRGEPLLPGWLGKAWACQQLSQAASGEYLLFTDADVHWQPGALLALMSEAGRTGADLLTIWPSQQTNTWAERLVVPLMDFAIHSYLPVLAVHFLPWRVFAAANGQVLLFKRSAYERISGHAGVRAKIIEDVALARAVKVHGLTLRMAEANQFIKTRMYHNWPEVRDGFAKNILAGHGGQPWLLLASTLAHLIWFVLPWGWLAAALLSGANPATPLILCSLGLLLRTLSAAAHQHRLADSLLMPLSVCLMSLIALRALYWHLTGQAQWKGRLIRDGKQVSSPQ